MNHVVKRACISSSSSCISKALYPHHLRRYLARSSLNRPGPPPLSTKDQQEFEELVRAAATPAAPSTVVVQKGEELHPDARRRPVPDFEGDVNPHTGEVGGPKKEPVRHGDWSFGGRASDF